MDEKMKMILENDELMLALVSAKSPDQLMVMLEKQNMMLEGISYEDAFSLIQDSMKRAKNDELTDEELEVVSGGWCGYAAQIMLYGPWAKIVLPVVGVCVAFGVAKYLIGKITK